MSENKKKPDYNAERIMQDFIEAVANAFGTYDDRDGSDRVGQSLNTVAAEFGITALKARKLLITAGVYSTQLSRSISEMSESGMTVVQIMENIGLSRASVHSYLPYTKIPYKLNELSDNAERIKLCRERKAACKHFVEQLDFMDMEKQDAALWELLECLQGCVFYTAKGLKYRYQIKGGELFVDRKVKSITRATVNLAFHRALELQRVVSEPKQLGTFGASYLYPIFIRIGVIHR